MGWFYQVLFAVTGGFVTAWVMHRLASELSAVRSGSFAACRERSVITLAIVETVIDVTVEMISPVIIRPGANEYAAGEPLRPVVAVGRAVVGRRLVISVRTNRRAPDSNRNMRGAASNRKKDAQSESGDNQTCQDLHIPLDCVYKEMFHV